VRVLEVAREFAVIPLDGRRLSQPALYSSSFDLSSSRYGLRARFSTVAESS